jgi:hypothetical protein
MPKQKQPITQRPKDHDESVGNPPIQKGTHREGDEGLPGHGSQKGGLNRASPGGGGKQNESGRPSREDSSSPPEKPSRRGPGPAGG